jgi:TRAP-type mannitol/chloroaromatic compound transport system permease small subunit
VEVLLRVSRWIDRLNARIGKIADWMVLLSCLVSAGNATIRYSLDISSNAWLELQWYMFAVMVMWGAAYTLEKNEHVRVDILYSRFSTRTQIWVDLIGTLLFLLPAMTLVGWVSWQPFVNSYVINEYSSNAGGLLRWPVKLVLPIGFTLLCLQGVSEIIKRIGALRGHPELLTRYEKPLQ